MPWIPEGPYTTNPSPVLVQMPYFTTSRVMFAQAALGGFCLGQILPIGPTFTPFVPNIGFVPGAYPSPLPATLSAIRLRIGRTGAVSSANLIAAVWHTNYERAYVPVTSFFDHGLIDFTSVPPDAVGSVPLSVLPLVSSAYDNTCGPPAIPQTEITLDRLVVFSDATPVGVPGSFFHAVQMSYWQSFAAFYVDDGFVPEANLVVNASGPSLIGSPVANNLDFTKVGGFSPQWEDGPICLPSGPVIILSGVDLLLTPIATRRGHASAQVIG